MAQGEQEILLEDKAPLRRSDVCGLSRWAARDFATHGKVVLLQIKIRLFPTEPNALRSMGAGHAQDTIIQELWGWAQ